MPLPRKARSAESFTVLASWLQQPSHLVGKKQLASRLPGNTSLRYLSTAENILNTEKQSCLSEGHPPASPSSSYSNNNTHRQTHQHRHRTLSPNQIPAQVWHPGVETLLSEYYKLLESTAINSHSAATRYRPSMMGVAWRYLTANLPPAFQLRIVLSRLNALINFSSTASVFGIIAFLVTWLQILRILIVLGAPSVLLFAFVLLGVLILITSEEKYTAAYTIEKQSGLVLQSLVISKTTTSLDSAALSFLKCNEIGQSENPLLAVEWPDDLPKPSGLQSAPSANAADHVELNPPKSASMWQPIDEETLQADVKAIRLAVLGIQDGRAMMAKDGSSSKWTITAIQELCQVVGVEKMNSDRPNSSTIREKISELQQAVGI